jgi:UDP-GlcNAc:undecaprenyl-phosphate/decaprenyl-phosphate GlcNAc-1-phosphate transferase
VQMEPLQGLVTLAAAVSTLTVLIALPVAAAVIAGLLRSGTAQRLIASPSADRWHERPTPTFGGAGIFAGLLAGTLAALAAGALEPSAELLGILGGATILFVAGLADDAFSFGVPQKLAAQLAAAAVVIAAGVRVEIVDNDVLALAIGLIWIVGMTNAFNLLDNIDGLAATLAAIALVFFAIDAGGVNENDLVLVVALAGALACAGFLPFNVRLNRPAAVFMGDSGSQVLGFTLAALSLEASWKLAGTTVATLLLPILILAVPIVDTALVIAVRLLEGRPIYQGGRDHTSHRLVYLGLSERRALVLLALISIALGATSLGYVVLENVRLTLVGVLLTFALLVQFASFLADIERGPVAPRAEGNMLTRALVVHRRRLIEVVVDFALITASFTAAYQLRVIDTDTPWDPYVFSTALPVILAARYLVFIPLGLYRGVWRYAGARDAAAVAIGVLVSQALAVGFLATTAQWSSFPRAVFVVDAVFCILLIGASRFGERALAHVLARLRTRGARRHTVIVGAGRAGRSLVRELGETPGEHVVGFVDDDPRLRSSRLAGVPVLGTTEELEPILSATRPDRVLVTIPDAPRARLDAVVSACGELSVPCRFVRRELDLAPEAVFGPAE